MSGRSKTSALQFEMLVSWMERHGDLCKPKDGPRGKLRTAELWVSLVEQLNSNETGDGKSEEKWRKVWSDLKNNTKKKAAKIGHEATRTGGGPAYTATLNDLELRVLAIIGEKAAFGEDVAEVGINEDEMFPGAQVSIPDTPDLEPVPVVLAVAASSNANENIQEGSPAITITVTDEMVTRAVDSAMMATMDTQPTAGRLCTPRSGTPQLRRQHKRLHDSPPGQQRKRARQLRVDEATATFLRCNEETRAYQKEMSEKEEEREAHRLHLEERRLANEERRLANEERRLILEEGWQRLAGQFLTSQSEIIDLLNKMRVEFGEINNKLNRSK